MNSSSTDPREVRKFGFAALVFFGLLAAAGFWRHKPAVAVFFSLPAALGLGFVLQPARLSPAYRLWRRLAHRIGTLFTLVSLTAAYYLVITPAALILRVLGRRPLPLQPDPEATSYWVDREEPAQPRERFEKRF